MLVGLGVEKGWGKATNLCQTPSVTGPCLPLLSPSTRRPLLLPPLAWPQ